MKQFVVFIFALVLVNVVLAIFGSPMRISIIGSIVLTVIVGGVMSLANR